MYITNQYDCSLTLACLSLLRARLHLCKKLFFLQKLFRLFDSQRARYQQILDLLAELVPEMNSKGHKGDENSVFGMVQSAIRGPFGRISPLACWLRVTAATLAKDS
ncbi:hypothetical protein Y032_0004g2176 [Ancylostoma ceylanicum]|uniref:Uncharacterized protein n=1 Tax=Ancylostoma ceylanicum TaxID=53326 RepID=A0A016VV64_9BILA|nr:hypothetical protein Y032_0004g2176 [Ancylostoma ceylanicum]